MIILTKKKFEALEAEMLAAAYKKAEESLRAEITTAATIKAKQDLYNTIQGIDNTRNQAGPGFNFNDPLICVFSIERVKMNFEDERTAIGYYFKGEIPPKIHEWHFHCSRAHHRDLVDQFNKLGNIHKLKLNI